MLMFGTLAVLATWLAFIWIFDPDGFTDGRMKTQRVRSPALTSRRPSHSRARPVARPAPRSKSIASSLWNLKRSND